MDIVILIYVEYVEIMMQQSFKKEKKKCLKDLKLIKMKWFLLRANR